MCRTDGRLQQKIDVLCKSGSMTPVADAPVLEDFSQPISKVSDDKFPSCNMNAGVFQLVQLTGSHKYPGFTHEGRLGSSTITAWFL